ncbi:MAG: hypothetical protein F6J93_27200 [Oscillatoria sp. SIO1A7]|nr:hypothetical protein [Oscillatoria sp. SIO1A7]
MNKNVGATASPQLSRLYNGNFRPGMLRPRPVMLSLQVKRANPYETA